MNQTINSRKTYVQPLPPEKPLISVIIPVYNVAHHLFRCLDSIRYQTYDNLEIILIDDGSIDGSGIICDGFQKVDQRVKVHHQKNAGLSAARNYGLDICTGEYIVFIDSDDDVTKDHVEYLYNLIKKHQTKMSICGHFEIYPAKTPEKPQKKISFSKGYQNKVFNTKDCLEHMLQEEGFMVSAWGKMYHRNAFEGIRFPVGHFYEDVGTTYRVVMNCEKIAYGTKPTYLYYQNPASITNSSFKSKKLSLLTLTDKMCDEIDWRYKDLKDVTNVRRMHARFSILRQLLNTLQTLKVKSDTAKIIRYLRHHKDYILKNPAAKSRDRIAMKTLLISPHVFKHAWNLYNRFK